MKFLRNLFLIPIAIQVVVVIASRPGGAKGSNGVAGANDHASPVSKNSNHNGIGASNGHGSGSSHNQGQNNGHGSGGSHNHGQSNTHGSQGVNSIVNAIRSADQQVHAVNRAIRGVRSGGTINNLDSTLRSLTSTLKTTTTAIQGGGPLGAADIQSLNLAIQPFRQSIGSLVTQLVTRRDTIAQLCGCRVIEGAMNQIRSSTRVMFDSIKSRYNNGGHARGGHGFNDLHSLDSGIASYLNNGFAAFGFTKCIDTAISTMSTWDASTVAVTTIYVTFTSEYTYTPSSLWEWRIQRLFEHIWPPLSRRNVDN
ncbi:hypothetical protein F4818DRAFT_436591 [Hypoxylon cercidicola]|nr:hypothetical protein F4818DRAFT_436591 [Hypoxylon cercidicola]